MTKSNPLQSSFNVGELSDRLHARLNFAKYPNGLETCVNLIPLAEGGVIRRPSTRFIAETEDSTIKARLKSFVFGTIQAYMIEMGDRKFRFYRNQARINSEIIGNSIQNGSFTGSITSWDDKSTGGGSIAHDATNDRLSLIPGGTATTDLGIAEQQVQNSIAIENVLKFRVLGAPSDSIKLRIGTSTGGTQLVNDVTFEVGFHTHAFTTTAADFYVQFINDGSVRNKTVQIDTVSTIGNNAVSIDTPWDEADLSTLEGPQSADTLYLFHSSEPTYKLQRSGNTSWSLIEVAWQDGPWLPENTTSTTLTFSAAIGLGVTVTASSKTGINGGGAGGGFTVKDIGRLIRLTDNATLNWGWAIITAVASTTSITVDVRRTVTVTTAETTWRLGAWSSETGYPEKAVFYQQRLLPAATTSEPQTFDASNTSDFEVFSPDSPNAGTVVFAGTVEDDDSFRYTISADEVNAIRWLRPGKGKLIIGTVGGEWSVTSNGAVITPNDVVVDSETTHGSANIQPLRTGNTILFVQRALRKIREFGFNFDVDGFQAFDMTRLAYHVSRGGLVEMAYAEEPHAIVWNVRNDGQLPSMTYRREEDVVGWARHIIGGSFSSGDAVVESVAVIPGADGAGQINSSANRDEVWMTVKRTINGATKRYVEVFTKEWETGDDQEDAYYSDSIITKDGASSTSVTGLDHLEGETVKVLADGAIHTDLVVFGGAITLTEAAKVVQVGLGYTHQLKTLKLAGGTAAGTPLGRIKRFNAVTFVLLNSHTLQFGPSFTALQPKLDFRTIADTMDNAVPYFTGEIFLEFSGNWERDPRIHIQSDDPVPFGLLAMTPETQVKEMR